MPEYFRKFNLNHRRGGAAEYKVFGTKPVTIKSFGEPEQVYPSGELTVRHTPGTTTPHFPQSDKDTVGNPLAKALGIHPELLNKIEEQEWDEGGDTGLAIAIGYHSRYDSDDPRGIGLAKTVSKLKDDPRVNPETLFTSNPGKLYINEAFFDPSLTASVPISIGIAKNDFPNTEIVPSDDLSPHSSKLAQNALSRGLISPNMQNPDAEANNDFRQRDRNVLASDHDKDKRLNNGGLRYGFSAVPQNQVEAGRETVREMLRGPRKRNNTPVTEKGLSDQFLPGMEGFV